MADAAAATEPAGKRAGEMMSAMAGQMEGL